MRPNLKKWLRGLFATRRQTTVRRVGVSTARPRLEVLEDRCLLNAGYLDPTFGAAGAGVLTQGGDPVIQPNGELLVVNATTLTRYNTNGSLDTSFGSGGTATTIANVATALQSDGKILVLGGTLSAPSLERLNSNGTLDTSFGNNGIVSLPSRYFEIAVQSNGQIVVAGGASGVTTGGKFLGAFDLARYNSNGTLDTSFGQGGTVTTSLPDYGAEPEALLLQANGDILIVGNTDNYYSPTDWLMARYNTSGSLDTSFGSNGIVTMQSGTGSYTADSPTGAMLYPTAGTSNDGKIVVVGSNASFSSGPVLARFNTNGSLDTTFGNSGFVPLGLSPSGVAFDSSGNFVISGSSNNEAALERLNPDGTPDATFGSGGVVTSGLPGTGAAGAPAIYSNTGPDTADYGKIVTGGSHLDRFLTAAPASAPSFVVTGPSSITAGTPFSVTLTATDANGNVLTNYTGTVDFSSFDAQAVLPANYTFTAADQGVHTFTVTFKTASLQALFVADTATPSMNGREVGLQVNPGAIARFVLQANTTSVKRGSSFFLYVSAVDAYGNTTSFNGTVHFSSSDPNATLPSDETYPGNGGNLGTFILRTKGKQTITITDANDPSISGTLTFQVS